MASDLKTKRADPRDALVRAAERYPASAYSENSGNTKKNADEELFRAVKAFLANSGWGNMMHPRSFSKLMFQNTELVSATKFSETTGKIVVRFPVMAEYANPYQMLSGGAQATAHDYCTGWALLLIMTPGFWLSLGVSLSLNMTFLQPARIGDVLLMEGEILQAGPRNAILRGILRRERDGAIISTSEQMRSNIDRMSPKM